MNIYKFVNSRDVREYHKEIGYKYSPSEAAWLVYMCEDSTVQERHEAWRWIIDNMPDEMVQVYTYEDLPVHISLHRVLEEFIEREKEGLQFFIADLESKIFTFDRNDSVFSNWNNCYNFIKQNEKEIGKWPVCVRYGYIDSYFSLKNGYMLIDKGGKIRRIQKERLSERYIYEKTRTYLSIAEFFMYMTPSFPSPFKDGDIVYCWGEKFEKVPMVYTTYKETHDSDSDQGMVYGYVIDDPLECYVCEYYYENHFSNNYPGIKFILSLEHISGIEYYRGELKGKNKFLDPISKWLREEYENDLAQLLNDFYSMIK